MVTRLTFRPLQAWPGQRRVSRKAPKFKASWPETLALLEDELDKLRARDAVLLADIDARFITRDGLPYANATANTPGVILEFEKPVRQPNGRTEYVRARFPCDTYWGWANNVRAIALTLEALRAVSRYGATQEDEQYRGFLALPGPGGVNTTAVQLSPERAARILVDAHPSAEANGPHIRAALAASLLTMPIDQAGAFAREARAAAHPDRGGSADAFATVQAAYEVLANHHSKQR